MSSLVFPRPPAAATINQPKPQSTHSPLLPSLVSPPPSSSSTTLSQSTNTITFTLATNSASNPTHGRSLHFNPRSESSAGQNTTALLPTPQGEDGQRPGFVGSSKLKVQRLALRIREMPPQERWDFVRLVENDVGSKRTAIGDFNDLLLAFVLAGEPDLALKLFDEMPVRGLVPDPWTHSIMIRCYCVKGDLDEARVVANLMSGKGFRPSVVTLTILVSSLCKKGRVKVAFEVVEMMARVGCKPNVRTYNWLLKGLCYAGRVEEANGMLAKLKENNKDSADIYSYATVMDGLCKVGRSDEAFELLDEAREMGLTPNAVAYNTLFQGYCKEGRPRKGLWLMKQMKERGCVPDEICYSTLLHGLMEWGEVKSAFKVFREMMSLGFVVDERTMNSLLREMCRKSWTEERLSKECYVMFEKMKSWGYTIYPNTYCLVLHTFWIREEIGMALHTLFVMVRAGHFPRVITVDRIIRALCEDGRMGEALSVLVLVREASRIPSNVSYNNAIHGFVVRGDLRSACSVYAAALKQGVAPRRKPVPLQVDEFQ